MKRLALRVAVATAALCIFVSSCLAYTYFLTENLYTPNWSNWTVTGTHDARLVFRRKLRRHWRRQPRDDAFQLLVRRAM